MHPALLVDEILRDIASHLSKGSRLSMATTCVAFKQPALSQLWRVLEDLRPLVGLLGKGNGVPDSSPSGPAENSEGDSGLDWERWREYESQVWVIRSVKIEDISPGILEHAALETLLPNIRKATIVSKGRSSLVYLMPLTRLVAGVKLRELIYDPRGLSGGDFTPSLPGGDGLFSPNIFTFLSDQALSMVKLDLRCLQACLRLQTSLATIHPNTTTHIRNSMIHFIGTQRNLRHLEINNILDPPFALLLVVAGLPDLRILKTGLWATAEVVLLRDTPAVLPEGSFPALIEVNVETHAALWKHLDTILLSSAHRLRKLSLAYFWDTDAPSFPVSLKKLLSLEELDIKLHGNPPPAELQWPIQEDLILSTLATFTHLRVVSIKVPAVKGPDGELIQHLARSWPKLESLSLLSAYSPPPSPRYTINGLLHFARHCRNLKFLRIPVFHSITTPVDATDPEIGLDIAPSMKRALFSGPDPSAQGSTQATYRIKRFWPNCVIEFVPEVASDYWDEVSTSTSQPA